jgi:hypothetical protein
MASDKAGFKLGLIEIWAPLVSWESFGAVTTRLLGCSPYHLGGLGSIFALWFEVLAGEV